MRAAATGIIARGDEAKLMAFVGRLAARPRADAGILARTKGQELDVLGRLLAEPTWANEEAGRAALLTALAQRAAAGAGPEALVQLLELVTGEPRGAAWRQAALLDGITAGKRGNHANLPAQPQGWTRLQRSDSAAVRARAAALEPVARRRAAGGQASDAGAGPDGGGAGSLRARQGAVPRDLRRVPPPSGRGEDGKGPPLVESEWVLGTPERIVRIALSGLRGPVKVGKRTFTMEMPAMGALEDAQLADLITYVRGERDWGHEALPVNPATVGRIRKATAEREGQWTAEELLKVP